MFQRKPALATVLCLILVCFLIAHHDVPDRSGLRWYVFGALFQFDGPEGPMWKRWNEPMKNALVPNQHTGKDGCKNGSWNPDVDRWGAEGGRVYAVAINALTLEVYYRYANVFGGGGGAKKQ